MSVKQKEFKPPLQGFWGIEKGSLKIVFGLTIPILLELILSSLFGMVDHMMAGQYSTDALNAIGLYISPSNMFVVLFTAVNSGTSTRVAWNIGAGRIDSARRVMRTSIILNVLLGAVLTVLSVLSAPSAIEFLTAGEYGSVYEKGTVASDAVDVFRICSMGLVFSGVTMSITASLRGAGENRIPLIYNLLANFLNVVGNYIFIYGVEPVGIPEMGAQGAALSTAISKFLAMMFAVIFLVTSKKSRFSLKNKHLAVNFDSDNSTVKKKKLPFFVPDASISKKILSIGIPAAGESLILQLGMLLFSKIVVSTGPDNFAAHQVTNSINSLFITISTAFSSATGTIIGQHLGAKDKNGAKYYVSTICKLSFLISVITAFAVWIFAGNLVALYTKDANVIEISKKLVYICGFVIVVTSVQSCFSGALKGAGDTKFPLYSAIVCVLIIRVSLTALVVYVLKLGIFAIWCITLLDLLLRAVIMYLRYKSGRWEKYSKKANDD